MAIKESVNTNQQLADHIKKNLSKGYTLESLKFSLIQQGYSRTSVEKAIQMANKQIADKPLKKVEKPIIKYETISDEEMRQKVANQDSQGQNFIKRIWNRMFG